MANEMRDRLVELICQGDKKCDGGDCKKCEYHNSDICGFYIIADHLIENGVVVPPCKIGDTVYCINTFFQDDPRINECEVDTLHITSGKNRIGQKKPSYALVRNKIMKSLSTRIYFENFGEDVFLTKSEAEQKLKEMRGEQE